MAAVYIVVALLSLRLASFQGNASPVWPPTGLAIGMLLIFGRRYAIAIFLGASVVNLVVSYSGNGGEMMFWKVALVSLGIGTGNTLEALGGAWMIEKFARGRRCFDRVSTVLRVVFIGALLAPLLSACLGTASIALAGMIPPDDQLTVFLTWYTGNVVGVVTILPLILFVFNKLDFLEKKRLIETTAQLVLVVVVGQAIWGFDLPEGLRGFPNAYMAIPLILWAALRLGQPATVLSVLVLAAVAIAGTVRGDAVFPGPTQNHSLLYLQTYIGIIAVMGLAVSALVAELRATNEGLEEAVEERTVRLERVLREKDEFLSTTVHELQSPLAGLRNLLRMLREKPESLVESGSGAGQLIEEMENTADSILGNVKELLDSQRIEDGMKERSPSEEDLGVLFAKCVREQRPSAVTKDITIDLRLPDDPIQVVTIRESVLHILANLLSNAIKFTPPGRAVRLRLAREGDKARFEVQDEGPGIPRAQISRLFRKFQRSTAEPTGGENSTGLGLFIVGRLVDQLGGEIRCRSIEGEGACFIFDLPVEPGGVPENR